MLSASVPFRSSDLWFLSAQATCSPYLWYTGARWPFSAGRRPAP